MKVSVFGLLFCFTCCEVIYVCCWAQGPRTPQTTDAGVPINTGLVIFIGTVQPGRNILSVLHGIYDIYQTTIPVPVTVLYDYLYCRKSTRLVYCGTRSRKKHLTTARSSYEKPQFKHLASILQQHRKPAHWHCK